MNAKGTVQIRSNTAWRIETSSGALSFSPREGSRNGTVEVTWDFPEEQEDEDLALAEFTILSAAEPVTVPVRCHLPIRITRKEGLIFNQAGAESIPSIARLTFSRKVVPLEAWAPGYTELGIQAVDDHTVDVVMPANFVDLGEDYVNHMGSVGKIRMYSKGNVDSFTMFFYEYDGLDDVAYQSIMKVVKLRQPKGWESFVENYTERESVETDEYTVTIDPDEDAIFEILDEIDGLYSYVLIQFGEPENYGGDDGW